MEAFSSLGVGCGLLAALSWGSSDFSGGVASKRISSFQALILGSLTAVAVLTLCAWFYRESFPQVEDTLWALAAGSLGALGIAALYHGLAVGSAAVVAPSSAVVGALFPVVVGTFLEGPPGGRTYAGFVLGGLGIWLVARSAANGRGLGLKGLGAGLTAGLGFGSYFVCIAQAASSGIFAPLVVAKAASFVVALGMVALLRQGVPSPAQSPAALLAGVLDAGGNVFYMLAQQNARMDVAAVLTSMYPAATVVLAAVILKERVAGFQWLGVVLCLGAVSLIAS
ncbi:Glucose uptake protein GlcU [Desulfacinum hydrothermale DSM 13146]|uniref:Glucose uptake protein GlcU n=1 Tax=Desulfacinum hydrothermale DSM 13146 TaxID=1121390 RepID=A0A1W1XMU9_9BACT|nr:Glucose uptake protein GlcU [Desulfacinum hydrothermale DSM 13146]